MRRICSACASAIFPQPTIATLSDIDGSRATALEVALQAVRGAHSRRPSHQPLELRVRITASLPVGVPRPPIEGGRQLSLGPGGVLLPQSTEGVACHSGNRN